MAKRQPKPETPAPAASGAPAPTPLSPDELGRLGARLALALVLAQYAAAPGQPALAADSTSGPIGPVSNPPKAKKGK